MSATQGITGVDDRLFAVMFPVDPRFDALAGDVLAAPDGRTFMYCPDDDEEPGPTPWVCSRPGEHGDDGGWWYRPYDVPDGSVLIARNGKSITKEVDSR